MCVTQTEEQTSLKLTPPQSSSTGAAAASALQKKPSTVNQFIEEKQKISLSKERRAARTLGIIMGVFVICWLPFFLMYVILPFCQSCCPTNKFKNFITWLGYINSGLNPVIYTIFNLDYRRAFKRLLGIKWYDSSGRAQMCEKRESVSQSVCQKLIWFANVWKHLTNS